MGKPETDDLVAVIFGSFPIWECLRKHLVLLIFHKKLRNPAQSMR